MRSFSPGTVATMKVGACAPVDTLLPESDTNCMKRIPPLLTNRNSGTFSERKEHLYSCSWFLLKQKYNSEKKLANAGARFAIFQKSRYAVLDRTGNTI